MQNGCYKIKIGCTSEDELSIKSKRVSKSTINHSVFSQIISHLTRNCIHFVDSENVVILYKTITIVNNKGEEFEFTTKTLEFACKREIEECEFKNFITILKSLGFSSDCGTTIKFCGNLNTNNIYEYNFSTEENIANTIADKHQKNKSRYSTIKLN